MGQKNASFHIYAHRQVQYGSMITLKTQIRETHTYIKHAHREKCEACMVGTNQTKALLTTA